MGDYNHDVFAANGGAIPYDGWVEVTVNLPGNDDPNLSIKVLLLVSRADLLRTLLGFNVIQELIQGQGDGMEVLSIMVNLLRGAMEIESEKTEAMVSFNQTQKPVNEQVLVKVG